MSMSKPYNPEMQNFRIFHQTKNNPDNYKINDGNILLRAAVPTEQNH